VLFLHGGFAGAGGDWEMAQPYRDAGYIVMMPILRGENGQPSDYTMFYNEVEDVLAATDYLAALPSVDPDRMYLAGHSVGGTLTLLTAMTTNRFRAAASFSGSPDQIAWSGRNPEVVPFDPGDLREFQMRSPIAFATSFKCPVRIYYGSQERLFATLSEHTAMLARQKRLNVEAIRVSGDHFSAVPEEMQQSIAFFRSM
jgi:dipeptidyl aminopeptidase/acylaminoacyl peptidase